jgi:hypothetical protein
MRLEPDFQAYHRSIGDELIANRDRIRQLIGDRHWGTDGQHKEAVLRRTLRTYVSQSLHVGTGFVCGPCGASHQVDVLLISRGQPTLFRDGELVIVTPDTVAAIIEVKTSTDGCELDEALVKLADDIEMIRSSGNTECQAGFFIYEGPPTPRHDRLLEGLRQAADGRQTRAINLLADGPDTFVRYWSEGRADSPANGPVWHSYSMRSLAYAYFIGNVVWHASPSGDPDMQFAWFAVEGGKEAHRQGHAELIGHASGTTGRARHGRSRRPGRPSGG